MPSRPTFGASTLCSAVGLCVCLSMFSCKEVTRSPVSISAEMAQELTVKNFNTVFCTPSRTGDGQLRAPYSKISAKHLRVEQDTPEAWLLVHEDLSGTYLRAKVDKYSGIVGYVEVRSIIE